jgi:hypothetical protein
MEYRPINVKHADTGMFFCFSEANSAGINSPAFRVVLIDGSSIREYFFTRQPLSNKRIGCAFSHMAFYKRPLK